MLSRNPQDYKSFHAYLAAARAYAEEVGFEFGDRVRMVTEGNELQGTARGMEGVLVQADPNRVMVPLVPGKPYDEEGALTVVFDNPNEDLLGVLTPSSIRFTSALDVERITLEA